jgi:O-antigen/teichoic acid export membrane protein
VVAAAAAKSMALLTWVIVANVLGPQAFGQVSMLESTFSLLQNVGLFGLAPMATRYVAAWRGSQTDRASRVMGLSVLFAAAAGLLMAVALVAAAPWVASRWLLAPALAGPLRAGSVLLVAFSLSAVLEGALIGLEGFRQLTVAHAVAGAASIPLFALGAWQAGVQGVVVAMVAVALLTVAVDHGLLARLARQQGLRLAFAGAWRELRVLWHFSVPVFLSTQTLVLGGWLGSCLVARMPNGYAELGLYSGALRWQQVVFFLPYYVGRALFPTLAERFGSRDSEAHSKVLRYYLLLGTAVAAACAAALAAFAPLIMRGYGREFTEGWPVLVILAFTVVILPLRWTIEMVYRSVGVAWYEFLMNVLWTAALLAGLVVIPLRGSVRLALANLAAFAVTNLVCAIHIGYHIRRGTWNPPSAGSAAGEESHGRA